MFQRNSTSSSWGAPKMYNTRPQLVSNIEETARKTTNMYMLDLQNSSCNTSRLLTFKAIVRQSGTLARQGVQSCSQCRQAPE